MSDQNRPELDRVRARNLEHLATHLEGMPDPDHAARVRTAGEADLDARLAWAHRVEGELDRNHAGLRSLLEQAVAVGEMLQTIGPAIGALGMQMAKPAAAELERLDGEAEGPAPIGTAGWSRPRPIATGRGEPELE